MHTKPEPFVADEDINRIVVKHYCSEALATDFMDALEEVRDLYEPRLTALQKRVQELERENEDAKVKIEAWKKIADMFYTKYLRMLSNEDLKKYREILNSVCKHENAFPPFNDMNDKTKMHCPDCKQDF